MAKVKKSLYDFCIENEKYKHLLDEWCYEKNDKLGFNIKEIGHGTSKKVFWKCRKGHIFEKSIESRVYNKSGCPYCCGQKVLNGYNDIGTTHPNVLKEWDYSKNIIKPEEVSAGMAKKVWWLCDKGHSYEQRLYSHIGGKSSCPYCKGQKVLKGFNDIGTTHPYLLKEWDYSKNTIKPEEVSKGSSHSKVWWICEKGHSYQSLVSTRVRGTGCPICDKERRSSFPEQALFYYIHKCLPSVISGETDILKDYMFEIDIYIPNLKIGIEYDGYRWHKSKMNIDRDNRKDLACREKGITLIRVRESGLICLVNSINIFRNDISSDESLEKVIKEVLLEIGLNTDVNIERDRQFIYAQYIEIEKENSLAAKYPEIAKEWHPTKNGKLKPENISYATHKKVWWLCSNGHEYQSSVWSRTGLNSGCTYCWNRKLLKGLNDLASCYPKLLEEWDYEKNIIKPDEIFKNSREKVWWKCEKCGYSWVTSIRHRTERKTGCPACNKGQLLQGYNDFATRFPELLKEWDFEKNTIKPTEIVRGKNEKIWWLCPKGHSYATTINHRLEGRGCARCSFDRKCKKVINLDTGEIYKGITEARQKTGITTIHDVLSGRQKRAGGYHWEYYEEKE